MGSVAMFSANKIVRSMPRNRKVDIRNANSPTFPSIPEESSGMMQQLAIGICQAIRTRSIVDRVVGASHAADKGHHTLITATKRIHAL